MCCFNTEEMAYFSVGINPLSSPINVYFCTARGPPIIFLINNTWAWKFTKYTYYYEVLSASFILRMYKISAL